MSDMKKEPMKLQLPKIFGNNMVLQRNVQIPVWGLGKDNDIVRVTLNDKTCSAAVVNGSWRVYLPPAEAGGPYELTVEAENEKISFTNVMIGEVWICSGQSNMRWPLERTDSAEQDIPFANYPEIRLFICEQDGKPEPQINLISGNWEECSPQSAAKFSGVAYHFGRELSEDLRVPIGLIQTAYNGTHIQNWMSKELYESDIAYKDEIVQKADEKFSENIELYTGIFNEFCEKKRKALESEADEPVMLDIEYRFLHLSPLGEKRPSYQYNAMIKPLQPFAIRGVIWYQGEGNTNFPRQYGRMFPAMIKQWREDWGQGEFPFLFVQLPAYRAEPAKDWAMLRETQLETWFSVSNTGMAVAMDAGEENNLHPRNKKAIGIRLACLARALVYGRDIVYSGPVFDRAEIKGDKVEISFKYVGGGLVARNECLKGFEICGPDGAFKEASASIVNDRVIIWNDSIKEPKGARYAWGNYPEFSLYNAEGFPASPFRINKRF